MKPSVLAEAGRTIHGARHEEYGHPNVNFDRIARAWSAYLGTELNAQDVTMMMVILKAMRGREGYKRDTNVDIAGYAALGAVVEGDDAF